MSARACCGHIHVLHLYGCPSCEAIERRIRAASQTSTQVDAQPAASLVESSAQEDS